MSEETGEVRIIGADPERVVSVTVGELQEIVRSHPIKDVCCFEPYHMGQRFRVTIEEVPDGE